MNKWQNREKKLEKKRKRNTIGKNDIPHKDKLTRREIKLAQKNKEWDKGNSDSEGDDE